MSGARRVLQRTLLTRRTLLPLFSPPSLSASRTIPSAVVCSSGTTAASPPSSLPVAFTRPAPAATSVLVGLAGTLSFSMGLTTAAEAKEAPLPQFAPKDVVLYQYEACPFCNKVRAFLDFHNISYKIVEVNPLSKKEIKWSDYKKVPILVVDGEQLVDSSDIIQKLHARIHPGSHVGDDEELHWLTWVDNHLVHMLSPNIYRSPSEAIESFDYITSNGKFSFTERFTVKYAGAAAMYMVSKKLKKRHNITDERRALYDAVETWIKALGERDFLGGSKPNLADVAVFGVLRSIRHLRSGRDMMENTHIEEWYNEMENSVGKSSRLDG